MGPIWRFARRALLGVALAAPAAVAVGAMGTDAVANPRHARPWLGVMMEDDAQAVRVKHVVRTSPADRAGIRESDRLVRVNGARVAASRDVVQAVAGRSVGDTVDLTLTRGGREIAVRVELAPLPSHDAMLRMDHVGTFAPAWKGVEQVSGSVPKSIGDLRGRVVVIDFWATWCMPCRLMAPKLTALQARFGAQGLSVVGISSEEKGDVSLFTQRSGMGYGVAVDKGGDTSEAYTVASLPTLFVIDKRGIVRDVAVGFDPSRDGQLETTVKQLLAEPAPSD